MSVFPVLPKSAWRVLFFLSRKSASPSEISREAGIALSRVSGCVKLLTEARVLRQRRGYAPLSLEVDLKTVIKAFLADYSEGKLRELFYGKRLDVLLQVSEGYDSMEKLKLASSCPERTLKRILKQLQDALLIYQPKKGVYKVRREFESKASSLKTAFTSRYLDSLNSQGIDCKEFKAFGKNVLIKTTQKTIQGFVKTGFNAFHDYGVAVLETNDNYFANQEKPPSKEQAFIHALVFSLNHKRDALLCVLFADLNKLTLKKLKKLAILYKVEKEAEAVFEFLKGTRKLPTTFSALEFHENSNAKATAEFLPSREEYVEARRDYATT